MINIITMSSKTNTSHRQQCYFVVAGKQVLIIVSTWTDCDLKLVQ